MSPVLILSRLCLKRRFQFFGISETSAASTASTFLTVSSSITRRRPALPAFCARDHDRHVVVKDLDREVLAYLAEDVLLFLLDHLARPMMRVDHVVADLEIDVDDFALDLEILDLNGCLGNRVLLRRGPAAGPSCWFTFASTGPRG